VNTVQVRGNQTTVTTAFEKTGITLDITPQLVGRDYVQLQIKAEDSQVTERIPGPSGSLNPVISTRSASTDVSVRDGETIIIGGLLSSSTIESKTGLPIVSDIPLLGYLFSSTRTQEVKSELVFFITPRIIKQKEHTVILPPGERKRIGN
jgi:type II secretory pathway component GspD/PulD (secretin)